MVPIDVAEMPTAEKLRLMESLWDSLCGTMSRDVRSPPWHDSVLAERMQRLDAGDEPVSDWSDAKRRIREQAKTR